MSFVSEYKKFRKDHKRKRRTPNPATKRARLRSLRLTGQIRSIRRLAAWLAYLALGQSLAIYNLVTAGAVQYTSFEIVVTVAGWPLWLLILIMEAS